MFQDGYNGKESGRADAAANGDQASALSIA